MYSFSGKSLKSSDYVLNDNGCYCMGQKNNQEYGIDLTGEKYVSDIVWDKVPLLHHLMMYDVLLNTLGTGTMGRSGIWKSERLNAITDSCLYVIRCFSPITAKFLLFWFITFSISFFIY